MARGEYGRTRSRTRGPLYLAKHQVDAIRAGMPHTMEGYTRPQPGGGVLGPDGTIAPNPGDDSYAVIGNGSPGAAPSRDSSQLSSAITIPALVAGIMGAATAKKHRVAGGIGGAAIGALVGALLEHLNA